MNKNTERLIQRDWIFLIFYLLCLTGMGSSQDVKSDANEVSLSKDPGSHGYQYALLIPPERFAQPVWEEMKAELLLSLGKNWTVFKSNKLPQNQKFGKIISLDSKINGRDFKEEIEGQVAKKIQGDSQIFRILSLEESEILFIYGKNERARLIGGFYVAQLTRIDPTLIWKLKEKIRTPAYPIRLFHEDSPIRGLSYGANTILLSEGNPTKLAFFREAEHIIIDKSKEAAFKRTMENRRKFEESLSWATKTGLAICVMGDEFLFPREIIDSSWGVKVVHDNFSRDQMTLPVGLGRVFCFAKPALWNLLKSKYREILADYREIDMIMIRLGENMGGGENASYLGSGVYPYGSNMTCSSCEDISYEDRIAKTINVLRKVIVDEKNRVYIHRTWDTKLDQIHCDPEVFQKVVSRLDSTENLILSTKYPAGDFWQYCDFNPTFGVSERIGRMAEFQCTREYEGKGAFPNFVGEEYCRAHQYLTDKQVDGIWCWHHGGGGGGPHCVIDLWNRANIYAAERLTWEPDVAAVDLARDYAAMIYGKKSSENMARLLLLSPLAVRKAFYFETYSSLRKSWAPSELWVRDDVIRGEKELFKIYRECKKDVEKLIIEKTEAISIVEEMIELLQQERKTILEQDKVFIPWLDQENPRERYLSGRDLYEASATALEYERALFTVFRDYCETYFFGYLWKEDRKLTDRKRAEKAMENWEKSWKYYNEKIPKLPFVASLYRDDGMSLAIEKIRRYLVNPHTQRPTWKIIGPFPNEDKRGFDQVFPPERNPGRIDFGATVKGIGGRDVTWQDLPEEVILDDYIDLTPVFDWSEWTTVYLTCEFESESGGAGIFSLGTDDAVKVWLNGSLVHENNVYRAAKPGEDQVDVTFLKGRNIILMKIMEGIMGTGFYFEIIPKKQILRLSSKGRS